MLNSKNRGGFLKEEGEGVWLPGPSLPLEILTRYLEQLLVELNNRKLVLLQIWSKLLCDRIRQAVLEGQNQAGIFVISAILLMFLIPYLHSALGLLSLITIETTACVFRFAAAGIRFALAGARGSRLL